MTDLDLELMREALKALRGKGYHDGGCKTLERYEIQFQAAIATEVGRKTIVTGSSNGPWVTSVESDCDCGLTACIAKLEERLLTT